MLSLLRLVPARSFEFGTRQPFLKPFRLQHRSEEQEANSRGGTLYLAHPLMSRVPQELTEAMVWSISNIYPGVWGALCFIFILRTSKREETSLGEHGMWIKRIVHEDSSSIILQPEDWTNVGHRLAYNLYREYNEYHETSRQQAALPPIQTKCCIQTTRMLLDVSCKWISISLYFSS